MSATGDKARGAGKVASGKVTGRRSTEVAGKADIVKGRTKGKAIDTRKRAEGAVEKVTGGGRRRRGSLEVRRPGS